MHLTIIIAWRGQLESRRIGRIIRQRIEFLSNRNFQIIWNRAARLRMRRWLSSTSRCGLYVFRWPTYTDIYWLVLTFLSCNFAESRMVRKRSIDPASNFHRGGERALLENSSSLSPIPKFPQLPLRFSPLSNN